MLKTVIILLILAVVGIGGGIAALAYLGGLEEPPAFVETILSRDRPAGDAADEGPFFYNVQSWFEFTTPADSDALGKQFLDLEAGIQFNPPAGMLEVSRAEIATRSAERPNSRLRMTDASFDTGGIVWLFETEDAETTVSVRSTANPLAIRDLDFEQLFTEYRAATVRLLEGMGVEDYRIEAAFFGGGMGIYTKFATPEPAQHVVHMLQVIGTPGDQVVTVTFARPVDGLPLEWESIVQASMESVSAPGSLVQ